MNKTLLIVGGIVAAATSAIVGTVIVSNKKTRDAIKAIREGNDTPEYNPEERKEKEMKEAELNQKLAMLQETVDKLAAKVEDTNKIAHQVDSAMPDIATASQVYLSLYFENRRAAGLGPMANVQPQVQLQPQVTITPPNPQPQQPTQTNATQKIVQQPQPQVAAPNPVLQPGYDPNKRTGMFANLTYENGIIPGATVDPEGHVHVNNVVTD